MLSGFYTVASGVLVNQKCVDVIGNNLVNSQTPGFRSDSVKETPFEQELMSRYDSSGNALLGDGKVSIAVTVGGISTSFEAGRLQETGRKLDMAVSGDGFFSVKGYDGNAYLTRNGSFSVDNQGYLALSGVGRVQSANGDIAVSGSDISVGTDGTVKSAGGNTLGKILVEEPADFTTLKKNQNGLFTTTGQLGASGKFQLLQGNLELSNVDINSEMTNLIASQRALQNCASALKTIDSLDQKASAQIAAV